MEPTFPTFDIYSSPLVILLLQGLIFAFLILNKYLKRNYLPDLLLAIFLLLFSYERIHYTIGFMSWYDSYPNTKINYYLFPLTLAIGPLLYFYVRSITNGKFKFTKKDVWHFVPFIAYLLYRFILLLLDMSQEGFAETQNGKFMSSIELSVVNPLLIVASSFHMLIYMAFTLQLYWFYRKKIKQFYSNTYKLELNWVRNFLVLYAALFVYDVFQNITDSFVVELHWTQKWWFHFLSSGAILYFGIKGFFTKTDKLQDIDFNFSLSEEAEQEEVEALIDFPEIQLIKSYMESEKPHLRPDLNLKDLSRALNLTSIQLSEIINKGFGMNFNDFVNTYRIDEMKAAFKEGRHKQLSLVGIAYDCGFNSKATFNRVFKKLTGTSPSDYIKSLNV